MEVVEKMNVAKQTKRMEVTGEAIRIENVSVRYDEPVLTGVNLDIREAKITAIVGPNGAGKTTLLRSMLGLVKPYEGRVLFFDRPFEKAIKDVAYVPQHSTVNWDFPITVMDVVLMGRYQKVGLFKKIGDRHREIALQSLTSMGMENYANRQISQLSGGQKQRVFIARTLCQGAKILLMDEPLAGVDKVSEHIIMDLLKELRNEGKTIVCVHHELTTIEKYFDDVVFINRNLVAAGEVKEVFNQANIDKTYYEV